MSRARLIDEYFLENRHRVLDLAAYLDRLDRAGTDSEDDYRQRALREALAELAGGSPDRVKRIQMLLSDPTDEPRESSDGRAAGGAYDRDRERR